MSMTVVNPKLDELEVLVSELTNRLAAENMKADAELGKLGDELTQAKAKFESLNLNVDIALEQMSSIETLNEQTKKYETQLEEHETLLGEKIVKIEELRKAKSQVQSLQKQDETKALQFDSLVDEKLKLQTQQTSATEELTDALKDETRVKEEIAKVEAFIADLEDTLLKTKQDIDRTQAYLTFLTSENVTRENFLEKYQAATSERRDLCDSHMRAKMAFQSILETISLLQEEIGTYQSSEEVRDRVKTLRSSITILGEFIVRLRAQISEKSQSVSSLRARTTASTIVKSEAIAALQAKLTSKLAELETRESPSF